MAAEPMMPSWPADLESKDPLPINVFGGNGYDDATAIALDSSGNVYVAGSTASTNFPGTTNGAQASNGGTYDAFVAKLTSDLKTLSQSTYLGVVVLTLLLPLL